MGHNLCILCAVTSIQIWCLFFCCELFSWNCELCIPVGWSCSQTVLFCQQYATSFTTCTYTFKVFWHVFYRDLHACRTVSAQINMKYNDVYRCSDCFTFQPPGNKLQWSSLHKSRSTGLWQNINLWHLSCLATGYVAISFELPVYTNKIISSSNLESKQLKLHLMKCYIV